MTKYQVAELEGALLDAAVAKSLGWEVWKEFGLHLGFPVYRTGDEGSPTRAIFQPSEKWADAGPIIERERIGVWCGVEPYSGRPAEGLWFAAGPGTKSNFDKSIGATPLIAAMRAYVRHKLGAEVEL